MNIVKNQVDSKQQVKRCEGDVEIQSCIQTDCSQQQQQQQRVIVKRVDKFLNPITQNSKIHKISFRDEIIEGGNIHEVIEVENWKSYNIVNENEFPADDCSCLIQ